MLKNRRLLGQGFFLGRLGLLGARAPGAWEPVGTCEPQSWNRFLGATMVYLYVGHEGRLFVIFPTPILHPPPDPPILAAGLGGDVNFPYSALHRLALLATRDLEVDFLELP